MSNPRDGVAPYEWAKHLRPYSKRRFWKKVRRKQRKENRSGVRLSLWLVKGGGSR